MAFNRNMADIYAAGFSLARFLCLFSLPFFSAHTDLCFSLQTLSSPSSPAPRGLAQPLSLSSCLISLRLPHSTAPSRSSISGSLCGILGSRSLQTSYRGVGLTEPPQSMLIVLLKTLAYVVVWILVINQHKQVWRSTKAEQTIAEQYVKAGKQKAA